MDILALLNGIAGIVMLIMVVVMFVFLWQLSRLKDQLRQIKKNYPEGGNKTQEDYSMCRIIHSDLDRGVRRFRMTEES